MFPNARGTARARDAFAAEIEEMETQPLEDESEHLQTALEIVASDIQEGAEYQEEEVIEAYETYQQIRKKVQETKKSRGFRPSPERRGGDSGSWNLKGSITAKLQQAKSRTRCFLCQEVGHWKRECPKKRGAPPSAASANAGKVSREVMIVEGDDYHPEDLETLLGEMVDEYGSGHQEVFSVELCDDPDHDAVMLDTGDDRDASGAGALGQRFPIEGTSRSSTESHVVSSHQLSDRVFESFSTDHGGSPSAEQYVAGLECHGVPDTACRRSLIGESVLDRVEEKIRGRGERVVRRPHVSVFKFGNSGELTSHEVACIPCRIGGRRVIMQVAVLPGSGAHTPMLMSKEMLKALGAQLDMNDDSMTFTKLGVKIKLKETSKGHYAVPLFDDQQQQQHAPAASRDVFTSESPPVAPSVQAIHRGGVFDHPGHGEEESVQGQHGHPKVAEGPRHSTAESTSHADDARPGRDAGHRGRQPQECARARKSGLEGGKVQRTDDPDEPGLCEGQGLHPVGPQPRSRDIITGHAEVQGLHRDEGLEEDQSGGGPECGAWIRHDDSGSSGASADTPDAPQAHQSGEHGGRHGNGCGEASND